MSILTVRFIGIYCVFAKPGLKDGGDGNGHKRVVLPADRRFGERRDGPHIPYIELEVFDAVNPQGRFIADRQYPRDGVAYRRFHLSDGDRISIDNILPANGTKLNVLSTFTERVPSLTAVSDQVPKDADPAVIGPDPDGTRVAAYFDITHGDLHAGPPNQFPTRFSLPTNWPTRRLAQWTELQIPIPDGQGPLIKVANKKLGERWIRLSERAAFITIGNQLKEDIERNTFDPINPRLEDFRDHWLLYYDLFPGVPATASRPERSATVPDGCVGVTHGGGR
ncbi:MAG TPA: hypothetical protein VF432_09660 [Thermoanaerobaculia bacterium]